MGYPCHSLRRLNTFPMTWYSCRSMRLGDSRVHEYLFRPEQVKPHTNTKTTQIYSHAREVSQAPATCHCQLSWTLHLKGPQCRPANFGTHPPRLTGHCIECPTPSITQVVEAHLHERGVERAKSDKGSQVGQRVGLSRVAQAAEDNKSNRGWIDVHVTSPSN